jgi:hypothetical protein
VDGLGFVVGPPLVMFAAELKNVNARARTEVVKSIEKSILTHLPLLDPNFQGFLLFSGKEKEKHDLCAWARISALAMSVLANIPLYTIMLLKLRRIDPCLGLTLKNGREAFSPLGLATHKGLEDQVEILLRSRNIDPNVGERLDQVHVVPLAILVRDTQTNEAPSSSLEIADMLIADPRTSLGATWKGTPLKKILINHRLFAHFIKNNRQWFDLMNPFEPSQIRL